MRLKSLSLLLFLCQGCMVAMAQKGYGWQAAVPAPAQQGYHSILLPPAVTGRLRPDLGDIRLYNAQQQEVPYLLREEEGFTAIPVQGFTRTDSASPKQTYIKLQFVQPVYPELLKLNVTAPDLYLRQGRVILGKPAVARRKKRRQRNSAQPAGAPFSISSNEPATIGLPRQQVEELTILIDNEDNHPLGIADVKVLQLNRYLVAKLNGGEGYSLRFGSKTATAPAYDLQFFRDSIPDELPVLTVTDISVAEERQQLESPSSRAFIWAAIGVVAIALGYMTVRLLNEMSRARK